MLDMTRLLTRWYKKCDPSPQFVNNLFVHQFLEQCPYLNNHCSYIVEFTICTRTLVL